MPNKVTSLDWYWGMRSPTFDSLSNIQEFLQEYESHVPHSQRLKTLDVALWATPVRWWTVHNKNIATWETCHRLLAIKFGENAGGMDYRYDGQTNSRIHIESCVKAWKHRSVDEWDHLFIHTLDTNPMNWYTETKLHRGTESWSLLTEEFKLIFSFESKYPETNDALEVIRVKVFDDFPLPLFHQLDWATQMESMMECYNFTAKEDEDPHNVNIPSLKDPTMFKD